MPKNPAWSLGKTKRSTVKTLKYYETFPTFWEISEDIKIKMPDCQHSLDEKKYKDMAYEYRRDKYKFLYKDTIVIGVLNNTPYLIDGQHRIEMCRYLIKNYGELDRDLDSDTFRFCYNLVENEMELRQLFESVNHDSERNKWYLSLDDIVKIKMDEFTKILTQKYKKHFANTIIKNRYKYTIAEFRKELENLGFFQTDKSAVELVRDLRSYNDQYAKYYERELEVNKSTFHQLDIKQIEGGIVFSLIRNNFTNCLMKKDDFFFHRRKGNKKRITRKLKIACWERENPNCEEGVCSIPNCSLTLSKNNFETWHAGHIISEKNGGETHVDNLRPICPACNQSMGSQNWENYLLDN